jgi:hypothetical protein
MPSMTEVTRDGTRLEQLQQLALVIAASIDMGDESHSMAQLARQYRETIREIAELQGDEQDDIVSQLIANG